MVIGESACCDRNFRTTQRYRYSPAVTVRGTRARTASSVPAGYVELCGRRGRVGVCAVVGAGCAIVRMHQCSKSSYCTWAAVCKSAATVSARASMFSDVRASARAVGLQRDHRQVAINSNTAGLCSVWSWIRVLLIDGDPITRQYHRQTPAVPTTVGAVPGAAGLLRREPTMISADQVDRERVRWDGVLEVVNIVMDQVTARG